MRFTKDVAGSFYIFERKVPNGVFCPNLEPFKMYQKKILLKKNGFLKKQTRPAYSNSLNFLPMRAPELQIGLLDS